VPVRGRGGLVVMERGWFDMAVDPRRYRLDVPTKLVELLGRLLPAPDTVIVLQADVRILRDRKQELPPAELLRQSERWREIALPRRTARLFLDASQDVERLAVQATAALQDPYLSAP
ncbi:MAG: hypothetical protein ACRELC_05870, partial [Gemmatimonadota bacterium]